MPNWHNRREFLQSATVTAGIAALSGISQADTNEENTVKMISKDRLELRDGRIENNSNQSQADLTLTERQESLLSELRDNERIIPKSAIDFENAANHLNEEKRKGNIEFLERNGMPHICLTERGRRIADRAREETENSNVSPHHDGKNDYAKNVIAVPPNVKAWTDDDVTGDVVVGSIVVSGLLQAWGASGAVPATFAGIILSTSAGVIAAQNEGHGVQYAIYSLPPIANMVPTITSQ
ncbi:hypothetical protein [Haloarchaeobius baliensis]|uniref:hypothetical protein n=1 Tax=Haloarchaeobius baliensis TaxID=1670458 RepID=UPI003F880632